MIVQIHSFDPLAVEVAGESAIQPGRNQKKILELLATIIALGGRNVNGNLLKEILWPDAEGDLADLSLGISLHRLRKLIGKEAVLLNTSMVSLNDDCCWILLKQEQLLDRLIRLLNLSADCYEQHGENERTSQLLSKILELRPLLEANYRRLMQHYIKLGWP